MFMKLSGYVCLHVIYACVAVFRSVIRVVNW